MKVGLATNPVGSTKKIVQKWIHFAQRRGKHVFFQMAGCFGFVISNLFTNGWFSPMLCEFSSCFLNPNFGFAHGKILDW